MDHQALVKNRKQFIELAAIPRKFDQKNDFRNVISKIVVLNSEVNSSKIINNYDKIRNNKRSSSVIPERFDIGNEVKRIAQKEINKYQEENKKLKVMIFKLNKDLKN